MSAKLVKIFFHILARGIPSLIVALIGIKFLKHELFAPPTDTPAELALSVFVGVLVLSPFWMTGRWLSRSIFLYLSILIPVFVWGAIELGDPECDCGPAVFGFVLIIQSISIIFAASLAIRSILAFLLFVFEKRYLIKSCFILVIAKLKELR